MRRSLLIIGACVLMYAAKIEGVKNKNQQRFWELWDSDTANNEPGNAESEDGEFTIDDDDGSGDGDMNTHLNTHEDDEDFDVNSGDGEPEKNEMEKEEKPPFITDDEDDLLEGSGSGAVDIDYPEVDPEPKEPIVDLEITTKGKSLSACERLRDSVVAENTFTPDCAPDGTYKRKQCKFNFKLQLRQCWCVSYDGKRIPGTLMPTLEKPGEPDCDLGTNLKGCVFEHVQNGQNLLGAPKPRCDLNGDWEPIQCLGSQCWCVDKYGNQILGSFVDLPSMPNCDTATEKPKPTTQTPVKEVTKPIEGYKTPDDKVVVTDIIISNDNNYQEGFRPMRHDDSIFAKPGFLAAIIAGGVITLLLVVLLVMFIVYRMRKKDEGSYPLDEQKFQNYSYSKAPDKEFYA